jgi:RNA recognition motif-containing protein
MDAFETRDAMELLIGGARYEMVELPDSMMSTTLWVGNLCEFVTDEMLSEVFQQASEQLFVPACVARKPNMESLKYGFVAFRSEEEKEMAIDLFNGHEVNGKPLKVEPIKDHEKYGRIRVPGKIIEYAVGPVKMSRNGLNTMRRATSAPSRLGGNASGGDSLREERKARLQKRKTRGRYKNQQRKNSRASRMPYA